MRSPRATAISSRITHIAAILALAACATGPAPPCPSCPACPACPAPPKPVAEEARYELVDLSAIPGWPAAALLPSAKAFLAGCSRIAAASALRKACETARASAVADETSARRFFESGFSAYAITAADGSQHGLVTGYYEPILRGSRNPSSNYRVPVYGVPQDLIVVDLAELHPDAEARSKAIWCSGDRAKAWDDYVQRGVAPKNGKSCDDPVDALLEFGRQKRIRGTPTLFFADGTRVPGAIRLEQMEELLARAARK